MKTWLQTSAEWPAASQSLVWGRETFWQSTAPTAQSTSSCSLPPSALELQSPQSIHLTLCVSATVQIFIRFMEPTLWVIENSLSLMNSVSLADEVTHHLNDCGAQWLYSTNAHADVVAGAAKNCPRLQVCKDFLIWHCDLCLVAAVFGGPVGTTFSWTFTTLGYISEHPHPSTF